MSWKSSLSTNQTKKDLRNLGATLRSTFIRARSSHNKSFPLSAQQTPHYLGGREQTYFELGQHFLWGTFGIFDGNLVSLSWSLNFDTVKHELRTTSSMGPLESYDQSLVACRESRVSNFESLPIRSTPAPMKSLSAPSWALNQSKIHADDDETFRTLLSRS